MAMQAEHAGAALSRPQAPLLGYEPSATKGDGRLLGENRQREAGGALASGLGWFSIGLGVAELVAPNAVARLVGMAEHPTLLRLYGVREIAAGLGILNERDPAEWLAARVAGDAVDLATLAASFLSPRADRSRLLIAMAAVGGVTIADLACMQMLADRRRPSHLPTDDGIRVHKTMTILKPREEIYRFWKNFQEFPRFMQYLESVEMRDDGKSHWVAKGPAGIPVAWDAETTEDVENERISWRSLPGSIIETSGSVQFTPAPGDQGTEVRVVLHYLPPGGQFAAALAQVFGRSGETEVRESLRQFKRLVETGELATTSGQPRGVCIY